MMFKNRGAITPIEKFCLRNSAHCLTDLYSAIKKVINVFEDMSPLIKYTFEASLYGKQLFTPKILEKIITRMYNKIETLSPGEYNDDFIDLVDEFIGDGDLVVVRSNDEDAAPSEDKIFGQKQIDNTYKNMAKILAEYKKKLIQADQVYRKEIGNPKFFLIKRII